MATFNLRGMVAVGLGAVVAPFMLTTTPVRANDLTKIFADPSIPLTLQLNALDSNWKRLNLSEDSSSSLSPALLFGMSGALASAFRTDVYYTQGTIVTISKQKYLVVYRPESRNINLADLMRSGRDKSPETLFKELTPDSKLTLSLINLSKLDSLKNIQPFDLQKEIEDSKKAIPKKKDERKARPLSPKSIDPSKKP